jgi:molybdopterin-synthase adenylyltransferase
VQATRNPACKTCGLGEFPGLSGHTGTHATSLCGRNSVHIAPALPSALALTALEERLAPFGTVTRNKFMLRVALASESAAEQESFVLTIFPDGRLIVSGTSDFAKARSLYARYIGA